MDYKLHFFNKASPTRLIYISGLVKIGEASFKGDDLLQRVSLSDSVRELYDESFANCNYLEDVHIPETVIAIGDKCFIKNKNLKTIILPGKINFVGDSCFEECSGLSNVFLGNDIIALGSSCFKNCISLVTVSLPDFLKNIGSSCFEGCASLRNISFGTHLTTIGENAFLDTNIFTIYLPDTVKMIDDYFISNATRLRFFGWHPKDPGFIGNYAFINCKKLMTLNVTNINTYGEYAFENCVALYNVIFDKNVATIETGCFKGATFLSMLIFGGVNPPEIMKDAFKNTNSKLVCYIPKGTTKVYEKAFKNSGASPKFIES